MTPTRPGDPTRPPPITDLARWIGSDPHAAYRAAQWCAAHVGDPDDPAEPAWQGRWLYALGHLHALEAVAGRTVPRE